MEEKEIRTNSSLNSISVEHHLWNKTQEKPSTGADTFEILLIEEGKATLIESKNPFAMKKGDIFLLRPQSHVMIIDGEVTCYSLRIKKKELAFWIKNRSDMISKPSIFHLKKQEFDAVRSALETIQIEKQENLGDSSTIVLSYIDIIFTYFYRHADQKAPLTIYERICFYVQQNNREPTKITLDSIAAYVGYSRYYTSKIFRAESGISLQQYIKTIRIEAAKKMLEKTDAPISRIMDVCGFSSTSNFYSQFTNIVGVSPMKYREQQFHR